MEDIHQIAKLCHSNTEFSKFSEAVKNGEKLAEDSVLINRLRRSCRYFDITLPDRDVKIPDLKSKEDSLYDKYRLFEVMQKNNDDISYHHVGLYVNSVG